MEEQQYIGETEFITSGTFSAQTLQTWIDDAIRGGATRIDMLGVLKLTAFGVEKKKLLTPERALELFGDPRQASTYKWMRLWTAPQDLAARAPGFPTRIYMHVIAIPLWEKIYAELIEQDLIKEIYSIGWYNVRPVSGTNRWSLHSWALACDINPADNPSGKVGKMNPKIVAIFENNGFNWGGRWKTVVDFMHFELSLNAVEDYLAQNIAMDTDGIQALPLPNTYLLSEELRNKAAALAVSIAETRVVMQELESYLERDDDPHAVEQSC